MDNPRPLNQEEWQMVHRALDAIQPPEATLPAPVDVARVREAVTQACAARGFEVSQKALDQAIAEAASGQPWNPSPKGQLLGRALYAMGFGPSVLCEEDAVEHARGQWQLPRGQHPSAWNHFIRRLGPVIAASDRAITTGVGEAVSETQRAWRRAVVGTVTLGAAIAICLAAIPSGGLAAGVMGLLLLPLAAAFFAAAIMRRRRGQMLGLGLRLIEAGHLHHPLAGQAAVLAGVSLNGKLGLSAEPRRMRQLLLHAQKNFRVATAERLAQAKWRCGDEEAMELFVRAYEKHPVTLIRKMMASQRRMAY